MTLEELQAYFQGIVLSDEIELVTGVVINDVKLFLQSHFDYIIDNAGHKSTEPFLLRLKQLQAITEEKSL
jgi:hypothetical protein